MAGSTGRSRNGAITGINVTPLVDITLVLLIVFMVTAKLIVGQKAITVDLPKAKTGSEVQEVLSVVLMASEGMHVNGERVPENDDGLVAIARAAVTKTPELRAVVKADGTVSHARVMHALDQLRVAGIAKVAFGVSPVLTTGGAGVEKP
ncbi:biopolymer transporter ExbD [Pendulispora brunnea]|uniref:Biopolymer transporter ExbD n=1 Tax=Pendulispora brunnea TaxID=2905690 RepID=A0ABZ2K749_9BACT